TANAAGGIPHVTADQVNRERPQLLWRFADVEDDEGVIQRYVSAAREDTSAERPRPRNVAPQPHGQSRRDITFHLVEDGVQVRQQRLRGLMGCWIRRDPG